MIPKPLLSSIKCGDSLIITSLVPVCLNSWLIKNLELGRKYGIYEGAENLEALAYGKSPQATKGEYAGERMDVEHIVPKGIAPSLDNIFANLMWLPAPLNQSKSYTITPEAMEMALVFYDEGILPIAEFLDVQKAFEKETKRVLEKKAGYGAVHLAPSKSCVPIFFSARISVPLTICIKIPSSSSFFSSLVPSV